MKQLNIKRLENRRDKMRVILDIKDGVYDNLMYILNNLPDVKIIDEEFAIDEDSCLESLEKIKKGDLKNFREVKADELFDELGISGV